MSLSTANLGTRACAQNCRVQLLSDTRRMRGKRSCDTNWSLFMLLKSIPVRCKDGRRQGARIISWQQQCTP